jgi:outer membrane receptor for ferrienterochelin and colicin
VYFDYSSQTLGTTVNYSPLSWWSHEFGMGNDYSENTYRSTARRYLMPYDTNAFLIVSRADRRSLRYNTTLGVPLGNLAAATLTMGGDGWQSLTSSGAGYSTVLTGALTGYTSRDPTHNTGAFLQSQVTLLDRLFLTYGFRAEWNPAYGDEAIPNYVPRYGVAYTQEFSGVTAKLRASYGSSTRPPTRKAKLGTIIYRSYIPYFGANWDLLPNPQLGPEFQRGGEGGIELYFGGRGSLVVTRYNQTVERLITNVERVDSVQSFTTDPYGYCAPYGEYCGYDYWPQSQNINLGNIRNQGWELQGTTTNGPFTTRGTYSWTKSRVLGLDPQYALKFPAASYPSYQPGATFQHVAEHTWALGVTYARAGTTVALTANGTGEMVGYGNQLSLLHTSSAMRLMNDRWRVAPSVYETAKPAYMLADLMASHRITAGVEGLLQISNLADRYESDAGSSYAVIGRQTKVGLRMRF